MPHTQTQYPNMKLSLMIPLRSTVAWCLRRAFGLALVDGDSLPDQSAIYIANHRSNLDAILIWASLPRATREQTRPVAARDYWGATPIRRWVACQLFRALLLDRRPAMRRSHPLAPLMSALEAGESLILFPEGTRHSGPEPLAPLKAGIYHLHRHHPEVAVVPLWLAGCQQIFPKGALLPLPLPSSVTLGPPLPDAPDKQTYLSHAKESLLQLAA